MLADALIVMFCWSIEPHYKVLLFIYLLLVGRLERPCETDVGSSCVLT